MKLARRSAVARLADEAAVVEDRDAVADALDVVEDVGRVEDRRLALQRRHEVEDLAPTDRVEGADRLVEQQDARAGDERLGDAEPLAHAARVGPGSAIRGVGEADARDDAVDPGRDRRSTRSGESEATNATRLAAGHPVVEARLLGEEADLAPVGLARRERDAAHAGGADVGRMRPARILRTVVLPAPFGPRKP